MCFSPERSCQFLNAGQPFSFVRVKVYLWVFAYDGFFRWNCSKGVTFKILLLISNFFFTFLLNHMYLFCFRFATIYFLYIESMCECVCLCLCVWCINCEYFAKWNWKKYIFILCVRFVYIKRASHKHSHALTWVRITKFSH